MDVYGALVLTEEKPKYWVKKKKLSQCPFVIPKSHTGIFLIQTW
jgi:hypothetical protein